MQAYETYDIIISIIQYKNIFLQIYFGQCAIAHGISEKYSMTIRAVIILNYQTMKIILTITFSFNSLFHPLSLSESNQKSEKQIQKGKLNKAKKVCKKT